MQGVQVAPALNDENVTVPSGLSSQFKAAAPLQAPKPGSVLKSARKAFGNITNSGQPRGDATASKPKQSQPLRRAFCDITNSAAKPPAGPTTAKKAPATSSLFAAAPTVHKAPAASEAAAPRSSSNSEQAAPSVEQASTSRNQQWGDVEPERPAGKTWAQLEEERWAALDAEAARAADEVLRAVRGPGTFSFLVPPVPVDDDEVWLNPLGPIPDLPSMRPEPVPDVSLEDLLLPADTNLANLLPEITWPGDFDDEEQQEEDADDAGADGSAAAADHSVGGVSTAAAVPEGNCSGNSPVRDPAPPTATEGDCRSPEVLPW